MQRDVGRLVELATKFKEVGCLGLFLVKPTAIFLISPCVCAAMRTSLNTPASGDAELGTAAATTPSPCCLPHASRAHC